MLKVFLDIMMEPHPKAPVCVRVYTTSVCVVACRRDGPPHRLALTYRAGHSKQIALPKGPKFKTYVSHSSRPVGRGGGGGGGDREGGAVGREGVDTTSVAWSVGSWLLPRESEIIYTYIVINIVQSNQLYSLRPTSQLRKPSDLR